MARTRVQAGIGLLMAALIAAVLPGLSALPTASPAAAATSARTAVESDRDARALAGERAGRKAGATAGAKAGRKAAAMAGRKAALAGEQAGRKAGATAGARAGRRAALKGGSKAATRAGASAGAKAGRAAGLRAARNAPPDCGVSTYRKDDGTPWKCTLGEDFSGTGLNTTIWRVMTSDKFSYGDRPDCFVNDPDNVRVANGVLLLTSRREKTPFTCSRRGTTYRTQYSSGMVSTYEKWTQAYGRFEFRAKLPYTEQDGVQTSFWLWPDGETGASWPASGEIDVAEWYSTYPDRVIPYLHTSTSWLSPSSSTNNNCLVPRVQDWHTYLLEWTPAGITISYDGVECLYRRGGGAPFNTDYLIAMFQGFGLKKNQPTALTPAVSTAQIAWVRVWS